MKKTLRFAAGVFSCACAVRAGGIAEPEIHDIGILASTDPVAPDQACID